MRYGVAIAILDRKAGIPQFSEVRVNSEDAQTWLRRVTVEVDERADAAGYDQMFSIVTLRLNDGRVLERQASFAAGSPSKPITDEQLATKVRECLAVVGALESDVEQLMQQTAHLELIPDVVDLAVLRLSAG
jgi:2-methylcitrate dehydratase PrpD